MSKDWSRYNYDTHKFFRYLHDEGISGWVLVRRGAKLKGNPLRDEVVRG